MSFLIWAWRRAPLQVQGDRPILGLVIVRDVHGLGRVVDAELGCDRGTVVPVEDAAVLLDDDRPLHTMLPDVLSERGDGLGCLNGHELQAERGHAGSSFGISVDTFTPSARAIFR